MTRMICGASLALLLAPAAVALAEPSAKWRDDRIEVRARAIEDGPAFTCSTGTGASFLVGAAALGLLLRRRDH